MNRDDAPIQQPTIWVVGSTMVDMITYADRLPERGETLVGRSFSLGFGGKGANQAVMARRLGAEVAMVNCVGDDVFGTMTIENFCREGIDVTHVTRTAEASSGVAPIWVEPSGANRILVVPGANNHMLPDATRHAVLEAVRLDLVIGQLEIEQTVTAAAFAAAKSRGAITVLNPAPAAALDPDLALHTDWLIPNEVELATLADTVGVDLDPATASDAEILSGIATAYSARIIVTLGERGATLLSRDGQAIGIPATPVDAVDTTGAGDAFVGAFAYGIATGMTEEAAAQLGCLCATASVQRSGTQASFLGRDEVAALELNR